MIKMNIGDWVQTCILLITIIAGYIAYKKYQKSNLDSQAKMISAAVEKAIEYTNTISQITLKQALLVQQVTNTEYEMSKEIKDINDLIKDLYKLHNDHCEKDQMLQDIALSSLLSYYIYLSSKVYL